MNLNTPIAGLRIAESTDNTFVKYFICRVSNQEAIKLPNSNFSDPTWLPEQQNDDMKANTHYDHCSFNCEKE